MWDLIVSVPDHCLSFFFAFNFGKAVTSTLARASLCRHWCPSPELEKGDTKIRKFGNKYPDRRSYVLIVCLGFAIFAHVISNIFVC